MNVSRYYISAIVFNDTLYAIGGMKYYYPSTTVEIYDEKENTWKKGSYLNHPRAASTLFVGSIPLPMELYTRGAKETMSEKKKMSL